MSAPAPPAVRALFEPHRTLRAVIDSALEGRLGSVRAADPLDPAAALAELGCYAVLAGDATHPEALELLRSFALPREVLLPDDQRWRDLVAEVFGDAGADRPMRTFSPHGLDRDALAGMARALPAGYRIEPLDPDGARTLDGSLEPHGLEVFDDAEHLARAGLGFRVTRAGRTASTSTSYAISSERVEVAISTHPEHRSKGLATAVAATMLLHCLERGLTPEWSASNPVSKRLARRLGYTPGPLCDIVYVTPAT